MKAKYSILYYIKDEKNIQLCQDIKKALKFINNYKVYYRLYILVSLYNFLLLYLLLIFIIFRLSFLGFYISRYILSSLSVMYS